MFSAGKTFVTRESTSMASIASCAPSRRRSSGPATAQGLALAEVSRRCGINQPALSRSETGHNKNPTLETLWRYAAGVGKGLVLTTEAIRDTRPPQHQAKRVRAARESCAAHWRP